MSSPIVLVLAGQVLVLVLIGLLLVLVFPVLVNTTAIPTSLI